MNTVFLAIILASVALGVMLGVFLIFNDDVKSELTESLEDQREIRKIQKELR